jgi:hypothetical protein
MRLGRLDRRKHPRLTFEQDVRGALRDSIPVVIRDLSAGGLRLETTSMLATGQVHPFRAQLPGLDFSAQVIVTRCEKEGMLFECGAALVGVSPEALERLDSWLADQGVPTRGVAAVN